MVFNAVQLHIYCPLAFWSGGGQLEWREGGGYIYLNRQNSLILSRTKFICHNLFDGPLEFILFCIFFFSFFFLFFAFLCLGLPLLLLEFVTCCNRNLYFLDEEKSCHLLKVTTKQWDTNRWWQGGVEDIDFPEMLKKEHVEIPWVNSKRSEVSRGVHERRVEFPWVLLRFWPGMNFHQQGVSHNFAEFSGVEACFLRVKWQI